MTEKEFIEEIKSKISDIESDFKKYEKTVKVLNRDINSILEHKKIIDAIIEFNKNCTAGQKNINNQLLYFEAKTHLIVLLGNIFRIMDKLKYEDPLSQLINCFDKSVKEGKIFELSNLIKSNQLIINKINKEYWDSMPSDTVVFETDSNSNFNRFSKSDLYLNSKLKEINKLYKGLKLVEFRNNNFSHLDTIKGNPFGDINLSFYNNPDFQKLIKFLDEFLNLVYKNVFYIQMHREVLGVKYLTEHIKGFRLYTEKEYEAKVKQYEIWGRDYEQSCSKKKLSQENVEN